MRIEDIIKDDEPCVLQVTPQELHEFATNSVRYADSDSGDMRTLIC